MRSPFPSQQNRGKYHSTRPPQMKNNRMQGYFLCIPLKSQFFPHGQVGACTAASDCEYVRLSEHSAQSPFAAAPYKVRN